MQFSEAKEERRKGMKGSTKI